MTPFTERPVRRAIILAAGNGDRFHTQLRDSKLLQPLLGRPILLRTIEAARDAGVQAVTVVLGYQADRVRALVERGAPPDLGISFVFNPDWQLENGVSALAARPLAGRGHFALLLRQKVGDDSLLAVDARPATPEQAAEATKVRRHGSRIVAIGKDLTAYDALDTGVFVCSPRLFDALDVAIARGDTTLSGGIRELAARGLMHGVEIGDAAWCDIDTRADLAAAEALLGAESGVA